MHVAARVPVHISLHYIVSWAFINSMTLGFKRSFLSNRTFKAIHFLTRECF